MIPVRNVIIETNDETDPTEMVDIPIVACIPGNVGIRRVQHILSSRRFKYNKYFDETSAGAITIGASGWSPSFKR